MGDTKILKNKTKKKNDGEKNGGKQGQRPDKIKNIKSSIDR